GARADLKVLDEFLPPKDAFAKALENGFTTLMLVPPGTSGITGRALIVRTADAGGGYVVVPEGPVKINHVRPEIDRRVLGETLQAAKREIEKVEKAKAEWEAKKKAEEQKKLEEQKKKEEEAKKQGQPGQPGQPPTPTPTPQPTPNPPPQPSPQPPKD